MNEENFSAPEEQKEKKMKRFIWILAAIALVVVVAAACTQLPATNDPGEEPQDPINDGFLKPGDESSAVLLGMPVIYSVHETVVIPGTDVKIGQWSEWSDSECKVDMTVAYANSRGPVDVASSVASYFSMGPLNEKYEDLVEVERFIARWANDYVSKCGEIFQPLGWFGYRDGECTLPAYDTYD